LKCHYRIVFNIQTELIFYESNLDVINKQRKNIYMSENHECKKHKYDPINTANNVSQVIYIGGLVLVQIDGDDNINKSEYKCGCIKGNKMKSHIMEGFPTGNVLSCRTIRALHPIFHAKM